MPLVAVQPCIEGIPMKKDWLRANFCKNGAGGNILGFLVYESTPGDNLFPKILISKNSKWQKYGHFKAVCQNLKNQVYSFFCFGTAIKCN